MKRLYSLINISISPITPFGITWLKEESHAIVVGRGPCSESIIAMINLNLSDNVNMTCDININNKKSDVIYSLADGLGYKSVSRVGNNNKAIMVGDFKGDIYRFDFDEYILNKETNIKPVFIVKNAHDGKAINCLAGEPSGKPLLASAGGDGIVRVFDVRCPAPMAIVAELKREESVEAWSVRWSNDGKYIVCGWSDGYVTIWDINSNSVKWSFKESLKNGEIGTCDALFLNDREVLACCTNGRVSVRNIDKNKESIVLIPNINVTVWSGTLISNNKAIIAAGSSLCLYDIKQSIDDDEIEEENSTSQCILMDSEEPSGQPICSIVSRKISEDSSLLLICSFDQTIHLYGL